MLFENCCNLLIWIQIFYKVRNIFKKSSVRISFMSSFAVSLWFCTREKLNFLNKRLFYLLFWSPCFHRSMLRTRHGSLAQLIPEQTVSSWLPRIVPHVPQSYPEHNAVNSSVFPRPHPFFCYFFCLRVEFNHRKKKQIPTKKLKTRASPAELEYYANKRFKPFGAGQVYVLPGCCRIFFLPQLSGKSLTSERRCAQAGLAQLFFAWISAFLGFGDVNIYEPAALAGLPAANDDGNEFFAARGNIFSE